MDKDGARSTAHPVPQKAHFPPYFNGNIREYQCRSAGGALTGDTNCITWVTLPSYAVKNPSLGNFQRQFHNLQNPPETMYGKGIPGKCQLVPPGITSPVIPWKMQLCAVRKPG